MRQLQLLFLPPLLGWGIGLGAKSWRSGARVVESVSCQEMPSAAAREAEFSLAKFKSATGLPMHRMLAQILPKADRALMQALAVDLATRKPQPQSTVVWKAVFVRWVQLDPPAAMEFARSYELAHPAMTAWAKLNLDAAIAGVATKQRGETQAILETLLESDPARGARLLAEFEKMSDNPCEDNHNLRVNLFVRWAALEPQAALAFVLGPSGEATQSDLLSAVIQGWVGRDPQGCMAWIGQRGLLKFDYTLLHALEQASLTQPQAVLTAFSFMPASLETRGLCARVVTKCALADLEGTLAMVRQHFPEGALRGPMLAKAAAAVAGKDPLKAAAVMDEMGWRNYDSEEDLRPWVFLPEGAAQEHFTRPRAGDDPASVSDHMALVLKNLVQLDPERAVASFAKITSMANAEQVKLLTSFVPNWFSKDSDAALHWMNSLPAQRLENAQLHQVVKSLDVGAAGLADLAEKVPAGPLREALARQFIASQVVDDPEATIGRLPFTDPATQQAALDQIVRAWGETQPQAALERLLKEPGAMPETCQVVIENWAQKDSRAASDWVQHLPPGPAKDGAIGGLVNSLSQADGGDDPDFPAALSWALSMADAGKRITQAQQVIKRWPDEEIEAETMRESIVHSSLAEADQQELLQKLAP